MKLAAFLREERFNELAGIILLLLTVLVAISLASYQPGDIGLEADPANDPPLNKCGPIGAYISGVLLYHPFGWSAWLVPFITAVWAVRLLARRSDEKFPVKLFGVALVLVSSASILASLELEGGSERFFPGGIVGTVCFESILQPHFGSWGSTVTGCFAVLVGLYLATGFRLVGVVRGIFRALAAVLRFTGRHTAGAVRRMHRALARHFRRVRISPALRRTRVGGPRLAVGESRLAVKEPRLKADEPKPAPVRVKRGRRLGRREESLKPAAVPAATAAKKHAMRAGSGGFRLPSLSMLSLPPEGGRETREDLVKSSAVLEETLGHFGVQARVVQVNHGPRISSFELEPAPGVKVNRITTLSDDLALALKAPSVRIVAPIPGKSVVGVEIPNTRAQSVHLREILMSKSYREMDSLLPLGLGKDVFGSPVVADLAEMPHLLIAGTTGSGKTVCMNSFILSILFRSSPRDVRFVLIDPKMVELSSFSDIPHLLAPVVTNAKQAATTLKWMLCEMERRYELLAGVGARDIKRYNQMADAGDIEDGPSDEVVSADGRLPYIVVIIDELADLMAVAQASVEDSIMRLAQLSRAVGIHLLLATQRPSVDVITGVIKANFPYRISFQVSSKVDSRTVLDMNGAEKLLGKGDMLFLPPGRATPIRAQGSFVQDTEIEKVVSFLREQQEPSYREDMSSGETESGRAGEEGAGGDKLYEEAVAIILETGQASVSMLQRRLSIGYSRSARLIDRMEEEGIVGGSRGSKPRQVLITGQGDRQSS